MDAAPLLRRAASLLLPPGQKDAGAYFSCPPPLLVNNRSREAEVSILRGMQAGRSAPGRAQAGGPGRSLAYLNGVAVERVKHLGGGRAKALRQKGIRSVTDVLLHVPRRYIDRSRRMTLAEAEEGAEATVIGRVDRVWVRRPRRGLVIVEAVISDGTGRLRAVWFNQEYQARRLDRAAEAAFSGKIERYRGRLQIMSPAVYILDSGGESLAVGRVVPVHPAVGQVGPSFLRLGVHNALKRSRPITDPLPAGLRSRNELIDRDQALASVHFPESMAEVAPARRRLVFDEFFRLEVALAMTKQRRTAASQGIAHRLEPEEGGAGLVEQFVSALPFRLTGAQSRVIGEIRRDMASPLPMHRLLQGEVGSGKTVVAVAAALTGVQGGFQAAVMAPTEVLAEQHYEGVAGLLSASGMAPALEGELPMLDEGGPGRGGGQDARPLGGKAVRAALLTGERSDVNFRRRGRTGRGEMLDMIAGGRIDIVIGTHALIQEGVRFARLGAAVVDEQHRFGVHQRVELKEKAEGFDPDLLIMTATPIPRTLSMTLYGDLDVSELDEMPRGRRPVETWAASKDGAGLDRVQRAVRREVEKGRQAFVVCPLVEGSERSKEAAAAVAEHERLTRAFPDLRVGLLHGRMRPALKEEVMRAFRAAELDVLVATTVIEVGIDVPNATIMVIRDADRFGLSQLHQLRGRVGRGRHPAQCVLLADPSTEDGSERIAAMVAISDGFRLAEEDLRIRGHGTVFGARQSGFSDLRIADILRHRRELAAARREAFDLVERDPKLELHPEVKAEVRALLGVEVEWLFKS